MTALQPYTEPSNGVAQVDPTGGRLVAWAQAASAAHQLATALVKTTFVPKSFAGNADDATAAIILGDELGLSPLSALRSIYVIGGTPALYARTMVALVLSHGHQIWTEEESDAKVTVCGQRRGSSRVERVTWTITRAQKAGYTNNKKYATDPVAMLYARASGDVARRIAPDVLSGVPYSVEEIELNEPTSTTKVTRAEGTQRVSRKPAEKPEPVADPEPPLDEPAPPPVSEPREPNRRGRMFALFGERDDLGGAGRADEDRAKRLAYVATTIGREVESSDDLSESELEDVIASLEADELAAKDPATRDPWGGT